MKILLFIYIVLFQQLSLATTTEFAFGEKIETCLSQDQIWQDLSQAMRDSEMSLLWPNDTVTIVGDGLQDQSVITAEYKISFFYWPDYNYKIKNVIEGESFEYAAMAGHPFEGGAKIAISDQGLSRLVDWSGLYIIPPNEQSALATFKKFLPRFFSELKNNFKKAEKSLCANSF